MSAIKMRTWVCHVKRDDEGGCIAICSSIDKLMFKGKTHIDAIDEAAKCIDAREWINKYLSPQKKFRYNRFSWKHFIKMWWDIFITKQFHTSVYKNNIITTKNGAAYHLITYARFTDQEGLDFIKERMKEL